MRNVPSLQPSQNGWVSTSGFGRSNRGGGPMEREELLVCAGRVQTVALALGCIQELAEQSLLLGKLRSFARETVNARVDASQVVLHPLEPRVQLLGREPREAGRGRLTPGLFLCQIERDR